MAWMSDERYILFSDSREKKSIAASAHKQRTHCGKGGSVKFPSDFKSKKEIKAMSGECKSYRMNEPLTWEEFVEWPNEHKVTYITGLREKFGVSDKYIAEMFDISCMILGVWYRDIGLESKNDCDKNWSRDKFYAWRSGANTNLVEDGPDLTKPMTWEEFKKLSDEQKRNYITWVREKFDAPDAMIARMLGISQSYFAANVKKLGVNTGRNISGTKKYDKEGFMRWAFPAEEEIPTEESIDIPEVEDPIIEEPVEEIPPMASSQTINIVIPEEKKRAIPKSGTMTFEGDVDDILNSIRLILEGSQVEVTMSWAVKE